MLTGDGGVVDLLIWYCLLEDECYHLVSGGIVRTQVLPCPSSPVLT